MTRFAAALRWANRLGWMASGIGAVGLVDPATRVAGWSLLLGDLIGLVNVRMLASALRRGTRRLAGQPGASAAMTLGGLTRFGLILALVAWGILAGPTVAVGPLVAGLFWPEAVMAGLLIWGREPWEEPRRQEGDSA